MLLEDAKEVKDDIFKINVFLSRDLMCLINFETVTG